MKVGDKDIDLSQYAGAWAIDANAAARISQSIAAMNWESHLRAYEAASQQGTANGQVRSPEVRSGVAVVSVKGVMTKGGSSLSEAGSTVAARSALREARQGFHEGKIKACIMHMESPGGTVSGCLDLLNDWKKTGELMPTFTLFEDEGASACYFVGSQGGKVYLANETTAVGSIGAILKLADTSKAFEKEGVKMHVYQTGKHKAIGTPGVEITKEDDAVMQGVIEDLFEPFAAATMAARKMDQKSFGAIADGRVFIGKKAVEVGLADGVKSFEEVLAEAGAASPGKRPEGAKAMADEERKAASLADLEKAFPDAEAGFYVRQIRLGATLEEARANHMSEREANLKLKEKEFADREEKAKKEQGKKPEAKKPDGDEVKLEDPIELDSEPGEVTGDAKARYEAAIKAKMTGEVTRAQAHEALCDENPKLVAAWAKAEETAYQKQYPPIE